MTIKASELDLGFKFRVAEHPHGRSIVRCFACGACTAGCPIREIDEKYSPRKVLNQILLGMREEVYKNEFVWMCSSHFACYMKCPQGVNIKEMMNAINSIAERSGNRAGKGTVGDSGQNLQLDHHFKYEIKSEPGGERITSCFACGTCPSGCPEYEKGSDYNSQDIIRMALLGLREEVLSSEFVKRCSEHYRCYVRCPLGVRINEIMYAVKSLAVEEGYSNPLLTAPEKGR